MKEIIKNIDRYVEFKHNRPNFEGIDVKTNKQIVKLGLQNMLWSDITVSENKSFFLSEYDFEKFIGAELLDIKITNRLNDIIEKEDTFFQVVREYGAGTLYVDIVTSAGVLQFVAYRCKGIRGKKFRSWFRKRYKYKVVVISDQLKYEKKI